MKSERMYRLATLLAVSPPVLLFIALAGAVDLAIYGAAVVVFVVWAWLVHHHIIERKNGTEHTPEDEQRWLSLWLQGAAVCGGTAFALVEFTSITAVPSAQMTMEKDESGRTAKYCIDKRPDGRTALRVSLMLKIENKGKVVLDGVEAEAKLMVKAGDKSTCYGVPIGKGDTPCNGESPQAGHSSYHEFGSGALSPESFSTLVFQWWFLLENDRSIHTPNNEKSDYADYESIGTIAGAAEAKGTTPNALRSNKTSEWIISSTVRYRVKGSVRASAKETLKLSLGQFELTKVDTCELDTTPKPSLGLCYINGENVSGHPRGSSKNGCMQLLEACKVKWRLKDSDEHCVTLWQPHAAGASSVLCEPRSEDWYCYDVQIGFGQSGRMNIITTSHTK